MPPVSSRITTISTPLITSGLSGEDGDQFLDRLDRAQIGEQPERLAQSEQRLLGALSRRWDCPTSDRRLRRAESRRCPARLQHIVGQRSAERVERVPADHALLEFDIDGRSARDDLQDLQGFADDFGTDAVTPEN